MEISDVIAAAEPHDTYEHVLTECMVGTWLAGMVELADVLDSLDIVDVLLWSLARTPSVHEELAALLPDAAAALDGVQERALRRATRRRGVDTVGALDRLLSLTDDRGLDLLDVLTEARSTRNLVTVLQKNATKRGLTERIAAALIEHRTPENVRVVRLGASTTSLRLRFNSEGDHRVGGNSAGFSKDADLLVVIDRGAKGASALLVSHKFARVGGGHQDNQKRDAIEFGRNAALSAGRGTDIPELRRVVSGVLDRPIDEEQLSWRPALVLDGAFFRAAHGSIRGELELGAEFAVGTTDELIDYVSSLAAR